MAPRLSTKPDASFFRKIVVGAVGARAVIEHLAGHGHQFVELERGSTDTKLWKEVKRKRVRIPDLVCVDCGQRIECRAKTKNDLSMSHSPNNAERAWNFGMIESDWIAFPVCTPMEETETSLGRLHNSGSYWTEENRITWNTNAYINYFTVREFESHQHNRSATKSGEEGAETYIQWKAAFSTKHDGVVEAVNHDEGKVKVRPSVGRAHTWTAKAPQKIVVGKDEPVSFGQILASAPVPISHTALDCSGRLPNELIFEMLASRQRTRRFTGVKLARFREDATFAAEIEALAHDPDEDVYVRLEGLSYLVAVLDAPADDLFDQYINGNDQQNQLEAVIALGESATQKAVDLLASIVSDADRPFFLRSAAAWSLGQTGLESAFDHLVCAFRDVDEGLRREALETLVGLGGEGVQVLLDGLNGDDKDVIAGCAEALRQQHALPESAITQLTAKLTSDAPEEWIVWLVGQLGSNLFRTAVQTLEESAPEIHYAIHLMWSFTESWIAQRWILHPQPKSS